MFRNLCTQIRYLPCAVSLCPHCILYTAPSHHLSRTVQNTQHKICLYFPHMRNLQIQNSSCEFSPFVSPLLAVLCCFRFCRFFLSVFRCLGFISFIPLLILFLSVFLSAVSIKRVDFLLLDDSFRGGAFGNGRTCSSAFSYSSVLWITLHTRVAKSPSCAHYIYIYIYNHRRVHHKFLRERSNLWKIKILCNKCKNVDFLPARKTPDFACLPVGSHSGRQVVTNFDGRARHSREGHEI
jgi:hypothetical protein